MFLNCNYGVVYGSAYVGKKLDHKVYLVLILSYAVSFLLEFYVNAEVLLSNVATC